MANAVISISKVLGGLAAVIFLLVLGALLLKAFNARSMEKLENWHKPAIIKDNLTQGNYDKFSDYLEEEKEFMRKIYDNVKTVGGDPFNRYTPNSISSPYRGEGGEDLNCSFELPAKGEKKGGILLVHGLTDSPYHLRSASEIFAENGYYVICLRLPGHGTIPGALSDVKWEEWYAAVKFGAQMLQKEISTLKDPQFFLGGFSTGGALTLRYVLENLASGNHSALPQKLFLFSPAIGVSWKAELADWHKVLSWIPFFRKFKWNEIKPEYDPFKYISFPKNAADQIHELVKANAALVKRLKSDKGNLEKMPPVYAFQSIADSTVSADKLIRLMADVGSKESELVLFDINHRFRMFFKPELGNKAAQLIEDPPGFKCRFIDVSNREDGSTIKCMLYSGNGFKGEEIQGEIKLEWPQDFFALSHVSIPIEPGDAYYGEASRLGGIKAKGEKKTLLIEPSALIRIRYNPFFTFVKERIEKVI
jgi:alpha-beta hydrolase superfamily lysophospholipase